MSSHQEVPHSHQLLLLFSSGAHLENGLELGDGDGAVEVNILVEPLVSQAGVATVPECLIDGVQILHSALDGDEGVRWLKHRLIVQSNSQRVPSLFDLGIGIASDLQIRIHFGHQRFIEVGISINKLQNENDFLVCVELVVVHIVVRR